MVDEDMCVPVCGVCLCMCMSMCMGVCVLCVFVCEHVEGGVIV